MAAAEGNPSVGGATLSSVNPHPPGLWHWRQATNSWGEFQLPASAFARTYYLRVWVCISAYPALDTILLGFTNGTSDSGADGIVVKVQSGGSAGKLFVGTITGFPVTSASAKTLALGVYSLVELSMVVASSGSVAVAALRIDGTVEQTGSGVKTWTAVPNRAAFAGSNGTITSDADDIAVNDSTGATNNTWPGDGRIVLLRPLSLNTNGGSWTDDNNATTSAALTNALDNVPPNGIADTTAGGGNHQVRNAAANSSLDMNLATYESAGISRFDKINVVIPAVNVAAPSATGAKSGSFGIVSNPAITNRVFTGGSGTATFFWRGAAAGTWPTNWGWEIGTITEEPTVVVSTSPIARLTITGGTTTRVAMASAVGLMVDFTPASLPRFLRLPQAVARAAVR